VKARPAFAGPAGLARVASAFPHFEEEACLRGFQAARAGAAWLGSQALEFSHPCPLIALGTKPEDFDRLCEYRH
jgi:hypothetical protein